MSGTKSFTDNSQWYYSSATTLAPKNTGLTSISPSANDGEALGTTALQWSDLFLASGGVLDWNNGDTTLTHSTDTLTFAGGVFALPDGTAANPSLTFSGDTNTGLFRTTTDTLGFATGGIQQVTINADGTIRPLAGDRTSTAASSPDWINVSGTYTLNSASGTFGHGYHFAATLVTQQSMSALGGGLLFRNTMTLKNANGVAANLAPFYSFVAQPTFQADGASVSALFGSDFNSNPTFNVINGGTLAFAAALPYSQFWAQSVSIGAGVTITTRIGFSAGNITNSGTVTNNYAFRADAQTGGTNNYGVAIGTASTNTLWVAETSNPTTAAGGIVAGSSKDTALFRESAHTWAIYTGATATTANLGGTLDTNTTTVGNVGAGEDDLMTFSIGASALATNGEYVEVEGAGTIANTVNAKRIRIKYGGTTILDTGAAGIPVSTAGSWAFTAKVIRTGAATQKCMATLCLNSGATYPFVGYSTAAETLSGAITFKVTGEATSNDDIVQEIMTAKWQPDN